MCRQLITMKVKGAVVVERQEQCRSRRRGGINSDLEDQGKLCDTDVI